MLKNLLNGIFKFQMSSQRFYEIKQDPEKAKKCVRYGISSIIASLVMVAFACFGLLYKIFSTDSLGIVFAIVFGIIFAAIGVLSLFVNSIINLSRQWRLNKGAVSIIALIVFVIALIASAFILYISFLG